MSAAFAVLLLFLAAATYRAALGLPEPRFEPLGPAFFPKVLSAMLGACALVLLAKSVVGAGSLVWRYVGAAPDEGRSTPSNVLAACVGLLLTAGYIMVLEARAVDYRVATFVFLFAQAANLMRHRSARKLALAAGVMLLASIAIHFVFTAVVTVDLP